MLSQEDLDTPKEYTIFEDPDQGSETKARNPTPNHTQRRRIHGVLDTSNYSKSNYSITVDLYTCVHGYGNFEIDGVRKSAPASLMIFNAKFIDSKGKGPFNWFRMTFEFQDPKPRDNTVNPDIVAYAPFRVEEHENETKMDLEKTMHKEATVQGGYSPFASAGIGYANDIKSSSQVRYFDRGSANLVWDTSTDRYNGVWWSMVKSDNPHENEGVRADFRCAILLKRNSDGPFVGIFKLDVDAGRRYALKQTFNDWRGFTEVDEPINFDPGGHYQGECKGIDRLKLDEWAEGDQLRQLTSFVELAPFKHEPRSK
jgi:hypothetical protein